MAGAPLDDDAMAKKELAWEITREIFDVPIQAPSITFWALGLWPSLPLGPVYLGANLVMRIKRLIKRINQAGGSTKAVTEALGKSGLKKSNFRDLVCVEESDLFPSGLKKETK
jgi:hypothetical protein